MESARDTDHRIGSCAAHDNARSAGNAADECTKIKLRKIAFRGAQVDRSEIRSGLIAQTIKSRLPTGNQRIAFRRQTVVTQPGAIRRIDSGRAAFRIFGDSEGLAQQVPGSLFATPKVTNHLMYERQINRRPR